MIKAAVCAGQNEPLIVKDIEGPAAPGAGQILIRTEAVAINPFDFAMQAYGSTYFPFLKFPEIFGEDVAGVVEAVGEGIEASAFKVGDRVAGLSVRNGFQERVTLLAHMSFQVPPSLPIEHAACLPMSVVVSVFGLFHPDYLALRHPTVSGSSSSASSADKEVVLIWGASTAVGANAVQLAALAGYEVITTASPANFDKAKKLGAAHVFDYASPTVVADIQAVTAGKKVVGAFANGAAKPPTFPGIIAACADVVRGQARPFLALTMVMPPSGLPEGIEGKFIAGVHDDPKFSSAILAGYLADALAAKEYQIAPEPHVYGQGLESLQGAMDMVKAGVSATKVVVKL
ncbi:hypothetical protein SEUCBS139899_001863 [Sporothrix eucalyptigena]|uniref:Enoyl reductase (ER) domain-containing protein n=1 Tax=Sporothrix eucalyptigena TaxID=1812306 RepID=A0ABP0D214_9PEZI